ncbi:PDR/VanB family oxidoreductase [Kitasatospora azatica]|uniref:PDR/VanB family oxidoreductase n=1 Tax=Kitasatospora azatica TaxID=58347 RepID=UPI00056541E1|nr:PDR/VanB family oxidoreductase [Kitasatospora azatica]
MTENLHTVVVADRRQEADGVISLTLRGSGLPAWEPGAHLDLLLADGLERQYSLCGNPAERDVWRIAVLRGPEGRGGSAFVHERLRVGETVRVRGPRNNFPLRPAGRYLFIAGGIGITPVLPMLRAVAAAGADWSLLYGGRTRGSMAFLDELARYGERVAVRPQDETGLLDLASYLGAPEPDTTVYCCGPGALLDAVEQYCAANGRPEPRMERFQPKARAISPDAPFELVLARSGLTLSVLERTSVLETVRAAGVEVLYSCAEGTCGTCETDVLEGVPDHRDSVLTAQERAAGETMLICVSRCRGERLVLDL